MYNLIVAGQEDAWLGKPYDLESGRVATEYTKESIIERFKRLDSTAITDLQSYPAIFAYEDARKADARVGYLKRVRSRVGIVRIEYDFFHELPAISPAELGKAKWELDISKWEMNRTHWAVKDVDLSEALLEAGLATAKQVAKLPILTKTTAAVKNQAQALTPLTVSPGEAASTDRNATHPTALISYAWESSGHKVWVRDLGSELRRRGVDIFLDQWQLHPGDQLPEFMERATRESEFVVLVCTPSYKAKSEGRKGGVGYEGNVMTAELFRRNNQRKYIPVLRSGTLETSLPSWLEGKFFLDLTGPRFGKEFEELVITLRGERDTPPPLGPGPAARAPSTHDRSSALGQDSQLPPVKIDLGYKDLRIENARHEYRLPVLIRNVGNDIISDWSLEVEFPRALLEPNHSYPIVREDREAKMVVMRITAQQHSGPLYPGDEKEGLGIDYYMDDVLYSQRKELFDKEVTASFFVGDRRVVRASTKVRNLQKY